MLTAEQIENLRGNLKASARKQWGGVAVTFAIIEDRIDALCDMALSALRPPAVQPVAEVAELNEGGAKYAEWLVDECALEPGTKLFAHPPAGLERNQGLEEAAKMLDMSCQRCGGQGWIVGVEPDCCGRFSEHGACCGSPIPREVQIQCAESCHQAASEWRALLREAGKGS